MKLEQIGSIDLVKDTYYLSHAPSYHSSGCIKLTANGLRYEHVPGFPGRAVCYHSAPPQTRTSGFPAYGSSKIGFAELMP